jgi:hypothetical protein
MPSTIGYIGTILNFSLNNPFTTYLHQYLTPHNTNMIKTVPTQHRKALSAAIYKGELDAVKRLVEQYDVDANAFLDDTFYVPVLMEALTTQDAEDGGENLAMLRFFLEKGADPNLYCKAGYNSLHIAAQNESMARALSLFLDFGGDVNLTDRNGATVAYWAIQGFPWRKEGDERLLHLGVVEKILMLGADLDYKNKFGATPRKWLKHAPEDLQQLAKECEKRKPVYKPSHVLQPEFPSGLLYPEIAQKIWNELVPPTGPCKTVQGELLRAVEKLRDEAQRNGNINYHETHKLLAKFVLDTLSGAAIFDKKEIARIKSETKKLMKPSAPYTDDDVYDYLTDKICMFYIDNPKPISMKSTSTKP